MPGYKGHIVGGCVAGGLLLLLLRSACASPIVAAQWMTCCVAGSLFPDIDVKSKGQHSFYWIILGLLILCIFWKNFHALSVCSVLAIVPMLSKHRGLFHRGWFAIMAPLAVGCVIISYFPAHTMMVLYHVMFFSVGALSHLWLDLGWRRMWRW